MTDLIERQAAIDAICGTCHMRPDYLKCNRHPDESTSTWCEEVASLKALPSAQPEIIRCKDCKQYKAYEYTGKLACHYVIGGTVVRDPNDFCSRAERITDG